MKKQLIAGFTLAITALSLAGCQNYEATKRDRSDSSSISEALKNTKLTTREKQNKQTLAAYDNDNPYAKIKKSNGRLYQDGIEVPPTMVMQVLDFQSQRDRNLKLANKVIDTALSSKQKNSSSVVVNYTKYLVMVKPYSYQALQTLLNARFDSKAVKTVLKYDRTGYSKMARFALIQEYGLTKLPDQATATQFLQAAQYRSENIKDAINALGIAK